MTIDPLIAWMYRPVVALTPVAHQQRGTQILAPGEILDVVVATGGSGFLNAVEAGTGTVKVNNAIASGSTTTVGPYNAEVAVRVDSWFGSIALSIARLNK